MNKAIVNFASCVDVAVDHFEHSYSLYILTAIFQVNLG